MKKDKTPFLKKIVLFLLLLLYWLTVGLYIRLRYRLIQTSDVKLPGKGPYLLIGNHSNNFDGLFMQCICPRIIQFVVTDAVYKNKRVARLLNFAGYIPKRKHVSDSKAIRQILRTISEGGIVGVFPEGMRNWDGQTGYMYPAIFRLIQLLHVPVYAACFKGAYLSEPRWADHKRHGRIEMKLIKLFDSEDRPALSEIESTVRNALTHDDGVWQQEKRIPYKGKALCKGFERLLYVCPSCQRTGTMDSSADRIWCRSCNAAFRVDVYGFFHALDGSIQMQIPSQLNAWQLNTLAAQFEAKSGTDILMMDEGARLYCSASQDASYELTDRGDIALWHDRLSVGAKAFNLSELSGVSVYFKSHLEFRHGAIDYRVSFDDQRVSAYKWSCALAIKNGTKGHS